jgi:hypothetical protein
MFLFEFQDLALSSSMILEGRLRHLDEDVVERLSGSMVFRLQFA